MVRVRALGVPTRGCLSGLHQMTPASGSQDDECRDGVPRVPLFSYIGVGGCGGVSR